MIEYAKVSNILNRQTQSECQKFSTKYKKPLWITEWACHDFGTKEKCSPAEAEQFMKTLIEWFRGEGSSMVTRWAWFGAFPDMKK